MKQSAGVLIAAVLWTAGFGLWVVTVVTNGTDPNWLGIGLLWLWGLLIFATIGSALERMTNSRAGAWNGAAIGFLLVFFLAVPAAYFTISDNEPPSAEALLGWLAAMLFATALGAATGALGGWIIHSSRVRQRRREQEKERPPYGRS